MRKRNVTESLANDSNLCRKKSQVYDKSKAKTKDQAICHGEDPLLLCEETKNIKDTSTTIMESRFFTLTRGSPPPSQTVPWTSPFLAAAGGGQGTSLCNKNDKEESAHEFFYRTGGDATFSGKQQQLMCTS